MKKTVSAHVYNTIERYPQILKTPKVEKAMGNLKCWMALRVNRGFDNSSYKFFNVHPYHGKISKYFSDGWFNHQPVQATETVGPGSPTKCRSILSSSNPYLIASMGLVYLSTFTIKIT